MLKRIMIALIAIVGLTATASAKGTYAHDASVLPQAAQTTISNNFKAKVSVVKIDKDFGRISDYEVILTDGTEISFDRDGNWENVEVNVTKSVPSGFVPAAISNFVKKNQHGERIIGIERDKKGYEVELSNGVDIKFDKAGNFKKYDR